MSRTLKLSHLVLAAALLAACGTATPEPVSTATATFAPTFTPVTPTSQRTQTATRTSGPTAPASTSTSALLATPSTPQPDLVDETRVAQEHCYQDPRKALDDYLTFLYQGEYEKAAQIYASPYPFQLRLITPEALEPSERLSIIADHLRSFCEGYGTCLKHKIISEEILTDQSRLSEELQSQSDREMVFEVEFYQRNGEILEVVIPKAGGFESYTIFKLFVVRLNRCYKVIDTPPMTA